MSEDSKLEEDQVSSTELIRYIRLGLGGTMGVTIEDSCSGMFRVHPYDFSMSL